LILPSPQAGPEGTIWQFEGGLGDRQGLPDVPPELPVLPPERLMILVDPPEAPPGAPELPAMELPAVLEPPDGPPACDTVAPEHPIMVAVAADNRRMTRERCAVIGASDRSQAWLTAYPISLRFSVSEPLLPSDFLTGETPAQVPPRVGRRIRAACADPERHAEASPIRVAGARSRGGLSDAGLRRRSCCTPACNDAAFS